ncbi:hypothetical protein DL96DRAFT_1603936 [Flagelloscypha sp. PMI_526]|nr:hypothetical protein DL96DRAFT_1603936 [Flagelloscypha sp. PMI_526]
MVALSWILRQKSDWQTKIKDRDIIAKWRKMALASQIHEPLHTKLTERMVDYTLQELHSYAALADSATGITHACDDVVFWSKSMIPGDLKISLLAQVKQLEDVPEEWKDWHPKSRNQVLDLVHPSLYPIVYGKSYIRKGGKTKIIDSPPNAHTFTSANFCWMPSDFAIAEDGTAKLISPYINNIHPSNTPLMNTVEKLVTAFVPMWEYVIGSVDWSELPDREKVPAHIGRIPEPHCIWGNDYGGPHLYIDEDEEEESNYSDFEGYDKEERRINWLKSTGYAFNLPDSPEQYDFALEKRFRKANFKGHTLQVIVKLANIVLTPEQPEYAGGSWHVEGMLNERIVSTGIYYYDSSNITPSNLSFRTSIDAPIYHGQNESLCMDWLYGLDYYSELVEERGSVLTEENTCIGFPNSYQHQVSSFKLADPTKPGHRKIVALFLIDPSYRIPSATDVGMQQKHWVKEALHKSSGGRRVSRFEALPMEIKDSILDRTEGLMSRKEAEEIRLELMKERSRFVKDYNGQVMSVEFNFCEN